MLRVFLVPQGQSLSEDLPPTENVSALQASLAHQSKVTSKDVILLTGKGQLLEAHEILGHYDGGTEERPFFVYFRPGISPKLKDDSTFKRNVHLEQKLSRISASPSFGMLRQQTELAQEFSREGSKLITTSLELQASRRLLWSGWLALLQNFSSMQKTFSKHQKNLDVVLLNFKESLNGFEMLIEKTPEQLELLKKVSLPSFMDRSVFGEETHTLYNWINLQDEHSSLEELLKECQTALQQVDVKMLDELKQTASRLTGLADDLYQRETQERISLQVKDLSHISNEQKSTSQSLHATVQKGLNSGDAGTLASISLSNCQLLKLMNSNHQKLENSVCELNEERNAMRERIRSGLQSLAELQQEMTKIDSKLQLYSGQIQLLRRKFEVLEQICAAPDMLSCILEEIQLRKMFKKYFVEEGEKVFQRFEALRQKEKIRRQQFFDKCGQHFVFSLFPSFTDRLPRLINSVPKKFDEDICSLPTEDLNGLLGAFAPLNEEFIKEDLCLTSTTGTQTEGEDTCIDNKRIHNLLRDQSVQTRTHILRETETQTIRTSLSPVIDMGSQTPINVGQDASTQVVLMVHNSSTEISEELRLLHCNACTQTEYKNDCFNSKNVGVETEVSLRRADQKLRIISEGCDKSVQAGAATSEFKMQFSPLVLTANTQTRTNSTTNSYSQAGSGCIIPFDAQTQTNLLFKPIFTDKRSQTDPTIMHSQSTQSDIVTRITPDPRTSDIELSLNPPIASIGADFQGQVVALKAAVEGLQKQLFLEREEHKQRESELERDYKRMRKSMYDSQSLPNVITVTNLKVGDFALFLKDSRGNLLALSFDDRIYYLSHVSAEKFIDDISKRSFIPLKRNIYYGCITEKVLVQVQKEMNRLQVPVGQRLYKLSAREITFSEIA
ncbi:PREDICTED: putative leucine-rich repeat-containing protein DDB_G0290503 [Amphimedon queenslandica]|uniref:Uncharacterized protein n=1 Tax=Amphimedon queenslandica TaxID=400682 RepID=A0A1X7VKT6_AMPQE|nr:PREDICTED: putative leucine-rich repeat-containing protein DDB_G0290503 [Amphimedon queenslandica]|eukprot:XP_003383932.1 PREDICTED: putative leucine-rich repeat-containing protein DDB_G0290503 [Amphimedon queenslandica]